MNARETPKFSSSATKLNAFCSNRSKTSSTNVVCLSFRKLNLTTAHSINQCSCTCILHSIPNISSAPSVHVRFFLFATHENVNLIPSDPNRHVEAHFKWTLAIRSARANKNGRTTNINTLISRIGVRVGVHRTRVCVCVCGCVLCHGHKWRAFVVPCTVYLCLFSNTQTNQIKTRKCNRPRMGT